MSPADELEALESALLRLLPMAPPATTGARDEVAAEAGRWEAWQQVAHVLGVQLPYVVPEEEPVPYALTDQAHIAAAAARLRGLLAPSGARP
ncbi:hypothetical protein NW249_31310 [Streptomyces sp. OUCMDZ-4982]|uniref:hypothetical protein n=1 Tax=Streptomyces sp. OUCMDZ-4982 TaxID=2973090 RepID=UPI00215B883B|nr:hypothetical protein [Streptomyces sp. OUCMDZ-4982]MCR8946593.1 hypothetical protein [Streptomyces sp. OUCMDZ-4982]